MALVEFEVTLRLKVDPASTTAPGAWDWPALPDWAEHLREAPDFAAPLLRFIEEQLEDIETVIAAAENPDVADVLGEQFWEAVAELKSALGAEAANASSDAAAEEAIEQAEAWVTQHVSSSSEVIAELPARAAARG